MTSWASRRWVHLWEAHPCAFCRSDAACRLLPRNRSRTSLPCNSSAPRDPERDVPECSTAHRAPPCQAPPEPCSPPSLRRWHRRETLARLFQPSLISPFRCSSRQTPDVKFGNHVTPELKLLLSHRAWAGWAVRAAPFRRLLPR